MEVLIPLTNNDKFSFESLCSTCTNSCCHGIDCPPVFPNDLNKLAKIGKNTDDFIQILTITESKKLMQIKRKPNSDECIFFDSEKNHCGIYEHRPLDCQMYPFDINVIKGEPWWVVLSCNPNSDWAWTESHLEKLESKPELIELIERADIYDSYVSLGFDDRSKPRIPIRKVKLNFLKPPENISVKAQLTKT